MKAWAIEHYGNNSVLKQMDLPNPAYGPDDVLIEIRAASVNPVDFKIRRGDLRLVVPFRFPIILGNDCAGVVTKVGSKVSKFKAGDEVYTRPDKERIGTFAELIAAKESAVALKPKNISFEEAASLPLISLTCWQTFLEKAKIKAGDRVFIPAGSGGVGTFAIQLAKYFGAYVITNTSTKNIALMKSLGADEVIDYKKEDFSKKISSVDVVLDTMGGETQSKAFSILKQGGVMVSIVGPPTVEFAKEFKLNVFVQGAAFILSFWNQLKAKFRGVHYQFLFMHPDGKALEDIAKLVESKVLHPVVDRIFPFEKTNEAIAYLEAGHARGKVVISMGT